MSHGIYPVIHHLSDGLSMEQAELAFALGADGVFLISHHGADDDLPWLAGRIKRSFPKARIGINLLTVDPIDALLRAADNGVDMLWTDDCGVTSAGATDEAKRLSVESRDRGIEVFGSVAFKYQRHEPQPAAAAANAAALGFLPTTSGPGTGKAPEVMKIGTMRAVTQRLAVASGMTPENVSSFLTCATDFLVSTGVSKDGYRFDPARLMAFVNVIRKADSELPSV